LSISSRLKALNQIEFVRHGKNYLAGNFMVQGLNFISIPILTRLLSPEDYGLLAVFMALVAVFTILLGLNFPGAVTRKYYEQDETFGTFIYSTTRFILVFSVTFMVVCLLLSGPIGDYLEAPNKVVLLALGVSFFQVFSNLFFSFLQASQQSRRYAVLSFIQSLLTLGLGVGLILWLSRERYLGKMFAQLAIFGVFAGYSLIQLRKMEKRQWDFSQVRYAMHIGIPLIPHTLSHFILSSFDRLIINQLKDAVQTGLYSLAYNVGSLLMIIVGALNNAWVPIFFKYLNEERYDEIQKKSDGYALVILFCAFGLALFSKEIIMVMASSKYYAALHIIPVIVLGSVFIFLYQLCVNYTFYVKKNIWISINTLFCGGLNIGLNYLYIPKHGYEAAAWTTLVSYILLFAMNYLTARYFMKERLMKFGFKLAVLLGCVCLYLMVRAVSGHLENFIMELLFRVVIFSVVLGGMIHMFQRLGVGGAASGGNHEKID